MITSKDFLAACVFNRIEIVKQYISEGGDLNVTDMFDNTGLILASFRGLSGLAKLLIDAGADVNLKEYFGSTSLNIAIEHNHSEIIDLLIGKIGKPNNYDFTFLEINVLLNHNVSLCNYDKCKQLIEMGADVNYVELNDHGMTASMLMKAASRDYNITKLLLDNGADVHMTNSSNHSALDFAGWLYKQEICNLLKHYGAK